MERAGLIGLGITSGVDDSSVSDCFLDGGGHLSAGRSIVGISRIAIPSVRSCRYGCRGLECCYLVRQRPILDGYEGRENG
ncbi:hypothetical protein T03_5559 [Trichinella britovi]|uniref:Uncharacterized protein n=1 Tax=Trichinella britovi TaxID=45882 RepID=A0A0V1CBA3_TRIBR|nr:hypothetical protein T03_5559 [Trichinella britovi]